MSLNTLDVFEDGLDEEGNKRYLLIIVDNFDDIQEIEDKYMLIEMVAIRTSKTLFSST